MARYNHYKRYGLLFIVPQLLMTLIFFFWPALVAVFQSFWLSDPFAIHSVFYGLGHFIDLFRNHDYIHALWVSMLLAFAITFLTMGLGLLVAVILSGFGKSRRYYKTLLLWPYAVAPAVAALLWRFLFHPAMGFASYILGLFHINWDYLHHPWQALALVIAAASWQQFSYNFLFYYAAIRAIPASILEAAVLDGAGRWQRFYQIMVPMLSPTSFFLLIMNLIYGFFETFGVIHVLTHGGPGTATTNLIYKVYEDGMLNMDLGSAAGQSVLLMLMVMGLTLLQFRLLERKVHYQ